MLLIQQCWKNIFQKHFKIIPVILMKHFNSLLIYHISWDLAMVISLTSFICIFKIDFTQENNTDKQGDDLFHFAKF